MYSAGTHATVGTVGTVDAVGAAGSVLAHAAFDTVCTRG